jgi:glycosyltransferase involved in cell wall biosynthesis
MDMNPAPWVLVSAGFHELGGQSKANAALADHLLGRGTPVHLVGHDIDTRFRDRPGCTVHAVWRPFGADFLGVLALRRHGRRIARRVARGHSGARVLVNGGCCQWPDINWVHYVHAAWRASPAPQPLAARCKEAIAGRVFRRHERKALRAARLVLANSAVTRAVLIDQLGVEPGLVRTVYLGSDPQWGPAAESERRAARSWLGQAAARPLVVFVGGLGHDGRKGFDTLWAAWRTLCRTDDWDADLVVAGGGAALAWWRDRIAEAGLAQRVRLLGFTDRIRELLAAADLLVSPVRYEPYGLNAQEALCRGVPALVSARAGAAEQYPQELAGMILPDPEDACDLAARLRAWRADPAGWRDRFREFGAVLRRHRWEDMARQIVALAEGGEVGRGEAESAGRDASMVARPTPAN